MAVDERVCECGHDADEHGRPRCMAPDSYGFRCGCDAFIELDEDEDEPGDANDFVQPRHISRREEVMHAGDLEHFYTEKAQESAR